MDAARVSSRGLCPSAACHASSRSRLMSPPRPSVRAHAQAAAGGKDLTARLLQTALSAGLAGRLRAHKAIHVDVRSTAGDLAQGVFGGMVIKGLSWETPLSLTADAIEVSIGELVLDYMALVSRQSFALKNLPTGACKLRLTAADLGNFMTHPLLDPISSTAVEGKPFVWDRHTIAIGKCAKTGAGFVDFEGNWQVDSGLYMVHMVPVPASTPHGSSSLRVAAKRLCDGESSAATVAGGLAQMFSQMRLNLDGIELQKPSLQVLLPGEHEGVAEPMLEIQMKMRIRAVPPLNMQF